MLIKTTVHLDDKLHAALLAEAAKDNRSLSNLMKTLLYRSVSEGEPVSKGQPR